MTKEKKEESGDELIEALLESMGGAGRRSLGRSRQGGKINAMYARGMTVREIQGFLLDQYKVDRSRLHQHSNGLGSGGNSGMAKPAIGADVSLVVFFDALRVKIRDEGTVRNKRFTWRWG